MAQSYQIVDKHKYDPNKKNILLFMLERNFGKKTTYQTYKYILNTVEVLQKDFNVFFIPRTMVSKGKWLDIARSVDVLKDCIYINLDPDDSFIKAETGEKEFYDDREKAFNFTFDIMQDKFSDLLENENWIFDNLVGTITSAIFLPYERNHEILPTNSREVKLNEGAMKTARRRIVGDQQFFSFRMASQRPLYPMYLLTRLMKERKDLWHYSFCHDTSSIWYPFSARVNPLTKNVKCFYFVNDNRGLMRDFKEFPSVQIQDAYKNWEYNHEELTDILSNKKHDFIFGGTFPYDVGYRLNDWTRFFENLEVDATIRTQTDGTSTISQSEIKDPMETKKFKGKKIKDKSALDVIRSISVNKNVKPTVSQDVYHTEQKDYMFTIVLKCFYGKYDSLNFRIYSSLVNGVVPLIADDYDIDNLQVPEYFKKYISASSNEDIEEIVKFYKDHPNAYKDLFWRMYNYYVKPEHFDEDWYRQVFKDDYFKELYSSASLL